jgi:hypothetical protein
MIQPFAFVNSWTAKKESEQAGESEFVRKFQAALECSSSGWRWQSRAAT